MRACIYAGLYYDEKGIENQEKINSKADPISNDEGEMTSAEIIGIELPDLEKIRDKIV